MEVKTNYTEEELYAREEYVITTLRNDVSDSLSYDEWAAREYGECTVDTHDMAYNLYDRGYRREEDVLKKFLLEQLEPAAQCKGHEEDALDMFMEVVRKLRQDLKCYPEWESDIIKRDGYGL
jgi:hypothetical protein